MSVSLEKAAHAQFIPKVVEATKADAGEIYEVVNEAYRRDFFRFPLLPRARSPNVLVYFLDGAHTWYVIKDNNKQIVAAVLYSTDKAPETREEGEVHMLSARKEYWGKNLSALLLKKVEECALEEKKSKIRLIVANTNHGLIRLYARLGYRITGERFELPLTSIQPQYHEKNPDGRPKICCV